ncbi:MAG: hypothetical protein Q4F75_04665 [Pseudomonadota bacterium]|nr:hypothetical protein [Pseudomonadota bacterium]
MHNENFFEEFFSEKIELPADTERFHNRLDYYLRAAAEQMAKDFGLEAKDWPFLDEFYILRNGGVNADKLINFRRFTLVEHEKDTAWLLQMFQFYPALFTSRAAIQFENTFRFLLRLWRTGMDEMNIVRRKHPITLNRFWQHFENLIREAMTF